MDVKRASRQCALEEAQLIASFATTNQVTDSVTQQRSSASFLRAGSQFAVKGRIGSFIRELDGIFRYSRFCSPVE